MTPAKRVRATRKKAGPAPRPATPPSGRAAEPRRPQQERGQRRVGTILDAAAELIAEEGISAATMHRVARRSGTTVGSMYHFFPERDALLRALVERHAEALHVLVLRTEQDAEAHWSGLSTSAAVGRFLDPFLAYVDAHPDLLPLMRSTRTADWAADRDTQLDRVVIRLSEAVVATRSPTATPEERAIRAVAITAMAEGVVYAAARTAAPSESALESATLRQELRRALVAYLDSYAAPQAQPHSKQHSKQHSRQRSQSHTQPRSQPRRRRRT
jgi:AcrR family transcriptional regulator